MWIANRPILSGLRQQLLLPLFMGWRGSLEMSWFGVSHGVPGAHGIWRLSCADCPGWLTHMPRNLVLAVRWGHSKGCHLYGTTMWKLSSERQATTMGLSETQAKALRLLIILALENIQPHFCLILLVRRESQSQPRFQRRTVYEDVNIRSMGPGVGESLKISCHTAHMDAGTQGFKH